MKRLLIVTVLSGFAGLITAHAQSAVYFCRQNGTYGFCYGAQSSLSARECAYNQCIDLGGNQPISVAYTENKGFGCICTGTSSDGSKVIGVALGFDDAKSAEQEARKQCVESGAVKLKVKELWEDK